LIFLTSAAGIQGSRRFAAYGVVKAVQRGMAKGLAREWGRMGIRVNCIAPVAMSPALSEQTPNSQWMDRLTANRGLGRIGEAEADIGPVAVFLVSDLSRYITGQTIIADGGGLTI
jgi:3-oxoacyl-[acyl-carrier protein] reductase